MDRDTLKWGLTGLAGIAVLAAIVAAFLIAPAPSEAFVAPNAFRLFYVHVPAAWAGYVGFFVTFAASIRYLQTRDRAMDRIAASSAEVGAVMISLALFSGMAWARAEWGVFWRWDIKLIMVLILWLTYLGYLAVRSSLRDPDARARTNAVYGIVGFAAVPLSYMAGRIWVSLHPNLTGARGTGLDPALGQPLGVGILAFTILYAALTIHRLDLMELADEIDQMKARLEGS